MKTILLMSAIWFCAAASAADPAAGPVFGIWHIDGHGYQWQIDQIDAGLPMEPCVRMAPSAQSAGTNRLAQLEADAPLLERFSGMHIVLRMNNITSEIDSTIPRVDPLTEDNWHTSHMSVRRLADGTLDSTPLPSPFSGTAAWEESGRLWATSPWMLRLQEIVTNPTGVILRENNEGPQLSLNVLYIKEFPRILNTGNGKLVNAPKSPDLDVSLLLHPDGTAYEEGWTFLFDERWAAYRWKTPLELEGIDLNAAEWIEPRRLTLPFDSQEDFDALKRAQYEALYASFDSHLTDEWRGKLRTCGYGGGGFHNSKSLTFYPGFYVPVDITSPEYVDVKLSNVDYFHGTIEPPAWPEWSINAGYIERAIYTGALNGNCDVLDAESYAGWMTHLCWRMQRVGREARLVEWHGYQTTPDKLVVDSESGRDSLIALGREDVLTQTVGDYEVAVLTELARIHQHPTLNRYWCEGTTSVLDSANNDAAVNRVWATETEIAGETRKLLFVYTPCTLESIAVGPYTVGVSRFAYYLTDPLEPLPDVVPDEEPLTIGERVESLERRVDALEGNH